MGKSSFNFAASDGRSERGKPLGLVRFTVYAFCYATLAAIACLIITARH